MGIWASWNENGACGGQPGLLDSRALVGGSEWYAARVLLGDLRRVEFMSVKIRLKRMGAKNAPAYRIVVADSRSPRDGRCIEELGSYDPKRSGVNYTLNLDRAQYWLKVGAQPSETVASFIKRAVKTAAEAPAPAPAA